MSTIAQHKLSCLCFIEPFPLYYTSLTARRRTPEVIKMDRFRILSQTWFGCNFDTSYAPEHFCRSNTISHEKMNFQEDRAAGKSWSTAHNASSNFADPSDDLLDVVVQARSMQAPFCNLQEHHSIPHGAILNIRGSSTQRTRYRPYKPRCSECWLFISVLEIFWTQWRTSWFLKWKTPGHVWDNPEILWSVSCVTWAASWRIHYGADRYVFEAKFCDFPCNHIISMNCLLAFLLENEPEFSFVCRDIKVLHRLHILPRAFCSHHGDYRP